MNYTLALCKVGDISSWCLRAQCDVWKKREEIGEREEKKTNKPPRLQEPNGKSSGSTGSLLLLVRSASVHGVSVTFAVRFLLLTSSS